MVQKTIFSICSWFTIISSDMKADARKFMEIPASKRVVVCMRLPYEAIFIMIITLRKANRKLIPLIPKNRFSNPKTIAMLAPSEAPELTPNI